MKGYGILALNRALSTGTVNHSAGEYAGANHVHVNSTESMWALFRPSLLGTWHRLALGITVPESTWRNISGKLRSVPMGEREAPHLEPDLPIGAEGILPPPHLSPTHP